jgi:hypothetical protein
MEMNPSGHIILSLLWLRNSPLYPVLNIVAVTIACCQILTSHFSAANTFASHSRTNFRRFSQNCGKRILASSFLSVCLSAWNNAAPTGRIFVKFDISVFFENLSRKFKFHYYLTRTTGTFR